MSIKSLFDKATDKSEVIVSLIAGLIAIITALREPSIKEIFQQKNAFNSLTTILLSISSASIYIWTRFTYEQKLEKSREDLKLEKEDNRKNKLLLENSKRLIYDINIERHTDVITGIPNHTMFNLDVDRIKESIQQGELYQIILLDIDNFGSINHKYGYFKGDELIRAIAKELYYSMRRNETIYKNKFISNDEPLNEQIYRKYNGGDEFIIIIKGIQDEAVGFLTRLHRQLLNFSNKTTEILPEKFEINFHAGIAPLYGNDEPKFALERVEECFRIAKRNESNLRVKWFKNVSSNEKNPLYISALKEFEKKL